MNLAVGRKSLAVAGVLAFVAGLVAKFPAAMAIAWFAPAAVQAWGVEGTVWRGRATSLSVGEFPVGRARWDASVLSFLALRPTWALDVERSDGFVRGRVAMPVVGNSQQISGLEGMLELASLPRTLVPEGSGGQLSVDFRRLDLRNGWPAAIAGRAAVAELLLPGLQFALGPIEFVFDEVDGPPAAAVRSLGGPLAVDGTLTLPEQGQWTLDALLGPGENPPPDLVEGLQFVGEPADGGQRRYTQSGTL
jgi:hypothetical protein